MNILRYGYYATKNKYFFCYDPNTLYRIFNRMRSTGPEVNGTKYPNSIGGFEIERIRDLTVGYDSSTPNFKPVLPISASTQMITFYFKNGAVFTIRGRFVIMVLD